MYCYLVANVIIFPLRCFYKKRLFFEKHRFFSTFSEKQGHFSATSSNFHAIFRKITSIFHRNPQKMRFLEFPQNRSNKEHISTISPPRKSTVQPAGESKRNAPHYKKKLYSVILLTISCFNH